MKNTSEGPRRVVVAFACVLMVGSTGCVTYKSVTMTPDGELYVPYEKGFMGMYSSGIFRCEPQGDRLECRDLDIDRVPARSARERRKPMLRDVLRGGRQRRDRPPTWWMVPQKTGP